MKNLIKIFLLFCSVNYFAQQNLVPNPSFEEDTACPNNLSQLYKVKNWFQTNGTPDYFNRCYNGNFNYCSIPSNSFGYQNINSNCHSYCGILTYWPFNINTETLCAKLIDSLQIGTKYFFSIKVALANTKFATNNIGALFSRYTPTITAVGNPPNTSNIKFNQVIIDTLNWTSLIGSFVCDSNYKYISIGNFYDAANTNTILTHPTGAQGAYYFIDDVCLSNDSTYAANYNYNCLSTNSKDIKLDSEITVSPNPFQDLIIINTKEKVKRISIFNSSGLEENVNCFNGNLNIDCHNLKPGLYFLIINTTHKVITKKILKQ
ncbi:MAG: T9SS type A sorting domain-containing protein [Bacteroidetes bacterium]|nr:T9SS type A sorting domain-containing protein [Bacteroidota bacterium]MCA6444682.1 T9SS type A sorting domain-containing protein [Bacteroidota bacterium]